MKAALLLILALAGLVALGALAWATPTVRWTYSPSDPYTGEAVTLDGSASVCDSAPCTYTWTDDGPDGPGGTNWTLGTGRVLRFTFSGAGTKWVRLTVRNASGQRSSAEKTITVRQGPRPTPTPSPTPTDTATPTPTVTSSPTATSTPPPTGCDRTATPSTLASQFSAAASGQTICLASGSYGTFTGGLKTGNVTLRPADGASVTMALSFNPASGITIDGVQNLTDVYLDDARTKNITVKNSTVNGKTTFRTGNLANANILFDHNTHRWDACSGCQEARMWFPEQTAQPSGITVQNSLFDGGNSDGIQNGSRGTRILNNTFRNIRQVDNGSGVHADGIQLYGSAQTAIKGNFFYNDADCVVAFDQLDHEDIEDNVCVQSGDDFYGFDLESDSGSIFRHNTSFQRDASGVATCAFNTPCGTLVVGNKSGDPASVGTVLKDNLLAQVNVAEGSTPAWASEDHNMFTTRSLGGVGDFVAQPVFVGGMNPTTYAGFKLATGSPGVGAASDGFDVGARIP